MKTFNKKITCIAIMVIAIIGLFQIIICNNYSNAATCNVDGLTRKCN